MEKNQESVLKSQRDREEEEEGEEEKKTFPSFPHHLQQSIGIKETPVVWAMKAPERPPSTPNPLLFLSS